jgi:hypothetical protein
MLYSQTLCVPYRKSKTTAHHSGLYAVQLLVITQILVPPKLKLQYALMTELAMRSASSTCSCHGVIALFGRAEDKIGAI